ncbi:MAG: hypothetical protein KDD22_02340, partial [Bdellovibrionales bacterium]|nr:hypothetical protein [Bdellovibrionales bacterium]
MQSVTHLAQFLLHLDPPKNIARLSFYHYVKNWLHSDSPLTPIHIEDFFDRCLLFDYWQNHKAELGQTVFADLTEFFKGQEGFDLSKISPPEKRQIVEINTDEEFEEVVRLYSDS